MGLLKCSIDATYAGLNLSTCPTCPIILFFIDKSISSFAFSDLLVIGFSIKTCLFFKITFLAISK